MEMYYPLLNFFLLTKDIIFKKIYFKVHYRSRFLCLVLGPPFNCTEDHLNKTFGKFVIDRRQNDHSDFAEVKQLNFRLFSSKMGFYK